MTTFRKAEKVNTKLKIALTGPAGSGKTFGALRLAQGFAKNIALIDTEVGSSDLYADRFNFSKIDLTHFDSKNYIKAILVAEKEGFDCLIIDSLSHEWVACLDKVTKLQETAVNKFTVWGQVTPEHDALISTILSTPIHMIITMRSKMKTELIEDSRGKKVPKRVGMEPIQRDGVEYSFTIIFDIAQNHVATVGKDRTGLFDDGVDKFVEVLDEKHGKMIFDFLNPSEKAQGTATVGEVFPVQVTK